jgi:imidazolonepropionase-like amidohydrolase
MMSGMRSLMTLCLVAGCARPQPETTAFVNVNLLLLDDDRVVADETVLVRDGRIAAVGQKAPAGARIIDGRGKFLMPGLADMHVHLVRENDLALFVARGVTTVRNMWGAPMHLEWKERVKKGELLGPTLYTAGPIVDGEDPGHDGSLVLTAPEAAPRVVQLHKNLGYDFIKIYGGLPAPVFAPLMAAARAAGIPVVGHIPHAVSLWEAADAGMQSYEHMTGLLDALQPSPSAKATREEKLARADESKLAALGEKLREKNLWSCPTEVVKIFYGLSEAQVRERLARPEMRYVPACDRAVWEPEPDDPAHPKKPEGLDGRAIFALHEKGARFLAGTDNMNPLVVPGFSLHEELRLLHEHGLSAREALRAATRDAAEFLHQADEFGSLKVGQRADLLLLDKNPLEDLAHSEHIAGVMVRGRWLPKSDLDAMLEKIAADVDGKSAAFRGQLPAEGERRFLGRYEVTWRDVWFGAERVLVEEVAGKRQIRAEIFDPHAGQRFSLLLSPGASGDGERLVLSSDGAEGRGRVELVRAAGKAQLSGTLLSGEPAAHDEPLAPGTLLGAQDFFANWFLVAPRLASLAPGAKLAFERKELALGSAMRLQERAVTVVREADGSVKLNGAEVRARRYRLEGKPAGLLFVDESGFPLALELSVYGATVKITRVE